MSEGADGRGGGFLAGYRQNQLHGFGGLVPVGEVAAVVEPVQGSIGEGGGGAAGLAGEAHPVLPAPPNHQGVPDTAARGAFLLFAIGQVAQQFIEDGRVHKAAQLG